MLVVLEFDWSKPWSMMMLSSTIWFMALANVPLLIIIEHWHVKQWEVGTLDYMGFCINADSQPQCLLYAFSVSQHLPIQFLWYKVGGSKKQKTKRLSRAVGRGMDFNPSCKVRTLPLSFFSSLSRCYITARASQS